MGSSNRHDRRAVGSVVCAVAVSAATVSSTGMAVADASDEYFIADVREDSLLSGLDDQQLILLATPSVACCTEP